MGWFVLTLVCACTTYLCTNLLFVGPSAENKWKENKILCSNKAYARSHASVHLEHLQVFYQLAQESQQSSSAVKTGQNAV